MLRTYEHWGKNVLGSSHNKGRRHTASRLKIPVEDLAFIVCQHRSIEKWMGMFAVYLDASGTHTESPVLTISGFLAPIQKWKIFQSKWEDIIHKAGLCAPDGPGYFHMTDFENRQGPYRHWTDKKRVLVLSKLIRAIAGRVELAVSSSMVVEGYRQAQKDNPILSKMSPFAYCMRKSMLLVEEWANRHVINDSIAYVYESGDGYGPEMYAIEHGIRKDQNLRERFRFFSMDDVSKNGCNPLQAADLLAYECQKEMLNCHYPQKELRPPRRSGVRLLDELAKKNVECLGVYQNERSFVSLIEDDS